jgi:hypothetical protein
MLGLGILLYQFYIILSESRGSGPEIPTDEAICHIIDIFSLVLS